MLNIQSLFRKKSPFDSPTNLIPFIVLALTSFISHYYHYKSFGFYEDDYALVSPGVAMGLSQLEERGIHFFHKWTQGRPLGFSVALFLGFVGNKLGGLQAIYMIGYVIITTNACLFYIILKRYKSELFALTGALAFLLFPADSSRILLTHTFILHLSQMFLLLAALLYLKGMKVVSYIVIALTLITYESPFIVFGAIPLLKGWNKKVYRELLCHVGILTALIGIAIMMRLLFGSEIGSGVGLNYNIIETIPKILSSVFFWGPLVTLKSFFYGPTKLIYFWEMDFFFPCLIIIPLLTYIFSRSESWEEISLQLKFSLNDKEEEWSFYDKTFNLFIVAIFLLSLGYAVSFTHYPPTALVGRMTSVHLGATFGSALLFACIVTSVIFILNAYNFKNTAIVLVSLYFSLLSGYHMLIQNDYSKSWKEQRWFWSNILEECPDITEGTVIVYDREIDDRYILSNSWADEGLLGKILLFPKKWENKPKLYAVYNGNWKRKWYVHGLGYQNPIDVIHNASNVIFVQVFKDKLIRIEGTIMVEGKKINLKKKSLELHQFEKGYLYRYLIEKNHI